MSAMVLVGLAGACSGSLDGDFSGGGGGASGTDRVFLGTTAGSGGASGVVGVVVHQSGKAEANIVKAQSTAGSTLTCEAAVRTTGSGKCDPTTPVLCGDYCVPTDYAFICTASRKAYKTAEDASTDCGSSCLSCSGRAVTVTLPGSSSTGAVLSLSGSVSSDGRLSVSGDGLSLEGAIDGDALVGRYSGSGGGGEFSAVDIKNGSVTRYCGSFKGSDSGTWNVQVASGSVSGSFAGSFASGNLTGSVSGSTMSLAFGTASDGGSAKGSISGGSVSGNWSTSDGSATGTWSGSTSACAGGAKASGGSSSGGCKCYPLLCVGSRCAATL